MLKMFDKAPAEAFEVAMTFASRVLSAQDASGDHRTADGYDLADLPIRIFSPRGHEPEDMDVSTFVPRKLVYPVLVAGTVFALVYLLTDAPRPRASSLKYVGDHIGFQKAFRMADRLASSAGEREVSFVDIPSLSTYSMWVMDDADVFVDRITPRLLRRKQFENEIVTKLEVARTMTPRRRSDPEGSGFDFRG